MLKNSIQNEGCTESAEWVNTVHSDVLFLFYDISFHCAKQTGQSTVIRPNCVCFVYETTWKKTFFVKKRGTKEAMDGWKIRRLRKMLWKRTGV